MTDPVDPAGRLLARLEPLAPPPELRARALESARREWPDEVVADRWRRLCASRPLRLAWAAAVALLLAAHVVVTLRPARPGAAMPPHAARLESADLDGEVELPRLRLSYVAADGTAAPARRAPEASGPTKEPRS